MGEISFSNHISNKKSAINSKAKLAGGKTQPIFVARNLSLYLLDIITEDSTNKKSASLKDNPERHVKNFNGSLMRKERFSRNLLQI